MEVNRYLTDSDNKAIYTWDRHIILYACKINSTYHFENKHLSNHDFVLLQPGLEFFSELTICYFCIH